MGSPLEKKISSLIDTFGPLRFKEFMRLALYDDEYGFYQKHVTIGHKNQISCDFKTFPESSSPYFGISLANLIARLSKSLDSDPINIIEVGGGNGTLARDFLEHMEIAHPELFSKIRYTLIELSGRLYAKQKAAMLRFENAQVIKSDCFEHKYEPLTGFVINNELLDAFPIDLAIYNQKTPSLIYIAKDKNGLFEPTTLPCYEQNILSYLERSDYNLCAKILSKKVCSSNLFAASIPINLDMIRWYESISRSLIKGAIITLDYGFINAAEYAKELSDPYTKYPHGKLFRVFGRQINQPNLLLINPLSDVGKQDMTSDIDFSKIKETGEGIGLNTLYLGSQRRIISEPEDKSFKGYLALIQAKNFPPTASF